MVDVAAPGPTEDQLRAIGQIAVAFGDLEDMVELGASVLAGVGDVDLGRLHVRGEPFEPQLDKLERLARYWSGSDRPLMKAFVAAARGAAKDRNRVLHRGWEAIYKTPPGGTAQGLDALVAAVASGPPVLVKSWFDKTGQVQAVNYTATELGTLARKIEGITQQGEQAIWETISALVHPSRGDRARLWSQRLQGWGRPGPRTDQESDPPTIPTES